MSIMHHFTNEQARQMCEVAGIDWHWSYSIDERDPSAPVIGKINRYFSRVKVKSLGLSSSTTARAFSYFKREHPSGKTS